MEHLDHISSRFLSSFQSSSRTVDKPSPCLQPEEIQTKTKRFSKTGKSNVKVLAIAHRTSNNIRLFFHSHFLGQFSLSRKLKVFGPTRRRVSWWGSATQKYTAALIGSYLRAKIQKPSGVPIREITGICVKLHRKYVIFWSNLRLYDAGEREGKWNWAREKKSVGRVVYQ